MKPLHIRVHPPISDSPQETPTTNEASLTIPSTLPPQRKYKRPRLNNSEDQTSESESISPEEARDDRPSLPSREDPPGSPDVDHSSNDCIPPEKEDPLEDKVLESLSMTNTPLKKMRPRLSTKGNITKMSPLYLSQH
ncbi:Hypothetical protein FKW44_017778 [Caligus rogercresseyi]|uniref:Uncharacterized protein n=1 Tax=Caligus rogercresseyi TaxID=217165 RepID=A0A7T8JX73_CALRO|nr:Hypothetical protein FKW44_017778 [Caligus rogercresseyi]